MRVRRIWSSALTKRCTKPSISAVIAPSRRIDHAVRCKKYVIKRALTGQSGAPGVGCLKGFSSWGGVMARAEVRVLPSARNTVMVVDDQSTGRAILEQVVRGLDERVAVEGFARPVDAVVWATRHISDLVLVDYMMPEMDGIEFVKRLRALPGYEHVPIVMVTVHDDRKVRYAALDAGITDFLTKPVDARECLARCRNLLDRKSTRLNSSH